jgi:uncharacterized membrane protein YedE/YeeE
MDNFTPISALTGGMLIGVSAGLLLWFNGRIAGISGILNGLLYPQPSDSSWRLLFLIGLISGSGIYISLFPNDLINAHTNLPVALVALGGFLVGFGTRMGGGCTSGHGVCGLGRLSIRGFVATVTFLITGIVTVYLARHILGIQ